MTGNGEDTPASAERDIGALREGVAPVRDRLSTTLFLAAAVHLLVLLGVTFSAAPPSRPGTPGLDVILLTAPGTEAAANAEARLLAQATQRGSGTGETGTRVESGLPGLAPERGNRPEGPPVPAGLAGTVPTTLIRAATDGGESTPRSAPVTSRALPALPATGPLWDNRLGQHPQVAGPRRELQIRPDTRESGVALYLDRWRRHVEDIGTAHYPLEALRRGGLSGNPVLEIQLLADGTLGEVRLQRSSGIAALDRAAFGILRLAVPFEGFPPELRRRHDALRLSYEWQFSEGRLQEGGLR